MGMTEGRLGMTEIEKKGTGNFLIYENKGMEIIKFGWFPHTFFKFYDIININDFETID